MSRRQEDPAEGGAADDDGTTDRPEVYGISLDLLHDLLRQWHDLWAAVARAADELPAGVQASLRELPEDPQEGLHRAVPLFATSFHPDVVAFLVSNLDAAAATVEQLHEEERLGSICYSGDSKELEARVRRLESVLGGVGAVLRTIGPLDQRPPD